jgi:hypothetical protein
VSVHRFDLKKKEITVEMVVPEAHFSGSYEVKGKLLALPIVGKGPLDSKFCESPQQLLTTSVTNRSSKRLSLNDQNSDAFITKWV